MRAKSKNQKAKNERRASRLFAFCFPLLVLCFAGCTCTKGPAPKKRQQPAVVLVDPDEASRTPATAEKEPNDGRDTAQALTADGWVEGVMGAKDSDWYKLTISHEAKVARAQVRGVTGLDLRLEAYSAAGKRLVKVDNSRDGGGEVLVNLSVEPGAYYLRVSEVKGRGATAPYRVGYTLRPREEGEEVEPNWKAAMATPLAADQEAVGYLGWATDTDWYRVDTTGVSPSARLRVELDGVDGVRAHLSVRDAAGKALAERWTAKGGSALLANLAPPSGEQALHVVVRCRKETNVETRYYLRVVTAVPPGPTEKEPNDAPATAGQLDPGQALAGLLADRYDRDIFLVPAGETAWVALTARAPMGVDLELAVLDREGKVRWAINAAGVRQPEVIPALMIRPPGVLIQVRAIALDQVSGDAPYRISAAPLTGHGLEREPNDGPGDAALGWPEEQWPIRGFIHPGKDRDHYRLTAASDRLRLSLRPPAGLGLRGILLDTAGGGELARVQTEVAAAGEEVVLEVDVVEGREYLLRVEDPGQKGDPGQAYTILLENR